MNFRSVFVYTAISEISNSYDSKFHHNTANEFPEVIRTYRLNLPLSATLFVGGWSMWWLLVLPSDWSHKHCVGCWMCPTAWMKECEKCNPYLDYIHGPLWRVNVQSATNNTEHFDGCGSFSVRGSALWGDIVRK